MRILHDVKSSRLEQRHLGAAADDTTATIGRLLRFSGWLEVLIGTGHNVVGTLILVRPDLGATIVAMAHWPASLVTPIAPPEQFALVLAMSLCAGTAWMIFGAMLIWLGRAGAPIPDTPLLGLLLLHQMTFAMLVMLYIRWHVLALAAVLGMTIALSRAVALTIVTPPMRGAP